VELETCLVAKPFEHGRCEARHNQRLRRTRKLCELLDTDTVQPLDLVASDRRNEGQVIVLLPALCTHGDEVATGAMVAGPWVEIRGRRLQMLLKAPLRRAEERVEVARAISLNDTRARHDVQ